MPICLVGCLFQMILNKKFYVQNKKFESTESTDRAIGSSKARYENEVAATKYSASEQVLISPPNNWPQSSLEEKEIGLFENKTFGEDGYHEEIFLFGIPKRLDQWVFDEWLTGSQFKGLVWQPTPSRPDKLAWKDQTSAYYLQLQDGINNPCTFYQLN